MRSREDDIFFWGRGVHHYKACAEGSEYELADVQSEIQSAMMSVTLDTGFCPERWKKANDVMLEKIPGVMRSKKNQVFRISFARNIARMGKNNKGIIS
jgi:hypothetical protein